jgi:hypothetical protein
VSYVTTIYLYRSYFEVLDCACFEIELHMPRHSHQGVCRCAWLADTVKNCLSAGVTELDNKCGLYFSVWILLVACLMNFVKCLCIFYQLLLFSQDTTSLVTIGDAIASFLAKEDNTMQKICDLLG